MLIKLVKHEFRAVARILLWAYAVFAVIVAVAMAVSAISRGGASDPASLPELAMLILYAIADVAMGVITLVVVVLRFWRGIMSDEGYLSLTLPASRGQHVCAKLIVSSAWTIIVVVVVGATFMLVAGAGAGDGLYMGDFRQSLEYAGITPGGMIALVAAYGVATTVCGVLMLYAAMATGQAMVKRHRAGGAFLAYIILYIVSQALSFAVLAVVGKQFGIASGIPAPWFTAPFMFRPQGIALTLEPVGFRPDSADLAMFSATVFTAGIVFSAIMAAACWFLTRYMLNRRLDLP